MIRTYLRVYFLVPPSNSLSKDGALTQGKQFLHFSVTATAQADTPVLGLVLVVEALRVIQLFRVVHNWSDYLQQYFEMSFWHIKLGGISEARNNPVGRAKLLALH